MHGCIQVNESAVEGSFRWDHRTDRVAMWSLARGLPGPFPRVAKSRRPGKIKPQQARGDGSFSISYKLSEICGWGTFGSRASIHVFHSHCCVFLPVVCPITFWVHVNFAVRWVAWARCHSVLTLPYCCGFEAGLAGWPWCCGPCCGDFTWEGPEWPSGHGLLVVQGCPCL